MSVKLVKKILPPPAAHTATASIANTKTKRLLKTVAVSLLWALAGFTILAVLLGVL